MRLDVVLNMLSSLKKDNIIIIINIIYIIFDSLPHIKTYAFSSGFSI